MAFNFQNRYFFTSIGVLFVLIFLEGCQPAQPVSEQFSSSDRTEIIKVLKQQESAWNTADLEAFMAGYWQSDSLRFIGKKGLTYGWRPTLDNYLKSYPDARAMGKLTFELISLEGTGPSSAFMIGKWHLARTDGDLQGHFSLLWRKKAQGWCIVADHSS